MGETWSSAADAGHPKNWKPVKAHEQVHKGILSAGSWIHSFEKIIIKFKGAKTPHLV